MIIEFWILEFQKSGLEWLFLVLWSGRPTVPKFPIVSHSLHMYHHILESLKSLCITFLSGFFLHFLHPSHIISIPLRLLYLILVCITNINNRKWSEKIMKNSLLKITMKEMIVLFINHITIRSNWHTYPLINWVANPWIWAITFHWILKYLWCILKVCF